MTSCLEIDDLDAVTLERILSNAMALKAPGASVPQVLAGKGAALVFEKPSARTRTSTEMAVATLGGHPIYIRPEEVGFDTRETVEDVARTLAAFTSIVAARTFAHSTLVRMAAVVDVPVVNLLSDAAHPCQALADVLTLREHYGSIEGRRLVFVGDGNNVAASLAYACALTGLEFAIASPVGYELPEIVVDRARNLGGSIETFVEPIDAVEGADAIYADVFTSMGQEAQRAERVEAFARYQVDSALMATAKPSAVFMHCMPAHRGEEVAADVIDGPQSIIWSQAANRMDSVRALFIELLEGA
jgi:ornithine carbamoyltransferase